MPDWPTMVTVADSARLGTGLGRAAARPLRVLPGLALAVAGGLLGWSAPPSFAAPASVATTAAATAPAGGALPIVVPALPVVARSITDGQDPNALLQRAIALSSVGASQAPLEATLARAQQSLDAQSVTASRAMAAVTTATTLAAQARSTAARAAASASDLQVALRQTALRLYNGGVFAAIATTRGMTDRGRDHRRCRLRGVDTQP